MKKTFIILLSFAMTFVIAGGSGCILEDKVIQIVVTNEVCAVFHQEEDSDNFNTPFEVDYAAEIDSILLANGYTRADIDTALLVSARVTVTNFPPAGPTSNKNVPNDWRFSGEIKVARTDVAAGPVTIIPFQTGVSVASLVGVEETVPLHPAGVALINQALADFLAGENPVLVFTVVSTTDDIDPDPTPDNRMIFDWKAFIVGQIVLSDTVSVPDWP